MDLDEITKGSLVCSCSRPLVVVFVLVVAGVVFVILILNTADFVGVLIVVAVVVSIVVVAVVVVLSVALAMVLYFLFEECHSIVAAVAVGLLLVAATSL